MPPVVYCSGLPCAFAYATSSVIVLTGTAGWTTTSSGCVTTTDSGVKSRTASYGSLRPSAVLKAIGTPAASSV